MIKPCSTLIKDLCRESFFALNKHKFILKLNDFNFLYGTSTINTDQVAVAMVAIFT